MAVLRKLFPILLVSAGGVLAQRPGARTPSFGTLDQRALALQIVQQRAHDSSKPLESAQRAQEFVGHVNDFTAAWKSLLQGSANGVWDPKQAKAVRRAFERLVQSEGWIEQPR